MKMKITSLILLSFVFFRTTGAKNDVSGSTVEAECAEGWTLLADTCGDTESKVCVKIGHPLKFVSWSHMQYVCDMAGGYLPEPTSTTKAQLKLILESYHQLYGETLMYLGATDVTHQNEWKWFKSKADIGDTNWGNDKQSKTDNKDCLAQSSGTGKWRNVDCEENSHEDRVAFVCMTALTPTPTPTPTSCISGWEIFEGACYFLQTEGKDWDSANAACQLQQPKKFNAQLTSILNDEEYNFLQKMAGSSEFWMGANRQPRTLNLPREKWFWEWTDGSNWKYTKWGPGEPNGQRGRQFCVLGNWRNTKLWDDSNCDWIKSSICKYRLGQ